MLFCENAKGNEGSIDDLAVFVSQLQATGRTWFEFNESAANPCDIVDHGAAWSKNIYSAHHNPALYYVGVHGKGYDEAEGEDGSPAELLPGATAEEWTPEAIGERVPSDKRVRKVRRSVTG